MRGPRPDDHCGEGRERDAHRDVYVSGAEGRDRSDEWRQADADQVHDAAVERVARRGKNNACSPVMALSVGAGGLRRSRASPIPRMTRAMPTTNTHHPKIANPQPDHSSDHANALPSNAPRPMDVKRIPAITLQVSCTPTCKLVPLMAEDAGRAWRSTVPRCPVRILCLGVIRSPRASVGVGIEHVVPVGVDPLLVSVLQELMAPTADLVVLFMRPERPPAPVIDLPAAR